MSAAWEGVLYDGVQLQRLDDVKAVLSSRFGNASEAFLRFQAAHLLATSETASDFVTRRADDAKAIGKLVSALKGAESAMRSLSQPTRESLYHDLYMERVWQSFDTMAGIAEGVGEKLRETPFSDRENVRAIFLVEDSRRIWAGHKGKEAPASSLNSESPFAAFLADLFGALGVGAEPRSAFQAWRKYRDTGVF